MTPLERNVVAAIRHMFACLDGWKKKKQKIMRRFLHALKTPYEIPSHLIELKFVRSSGPGGQNVNKVSSACEARVQVSKLGLPEGVKQRLMEQQRNRINNKFELVVDCQEDRSQHRNREKSIRKLNEFVRQAFIEPKERIVQRSPPEKTKEKWREEKARRRSIKDLRGKIKIDD